MKTYSPVLTPGALASIARRKTEKIQGKLQEAEEKLHVVHEVLLDEGAGGATSRIRTAVKQNLAAEDTVHEAAEDLQEVKELLASAQADDGAPPKADASITHQPRPKGKSGQGARSIIPLLGGENAA